MEEGGGALLEDARENGITIGIANERPYGYEEGGEATGEAPELAKVIFERMGITEVDFEVSDFGALINGINAGRFDVIAAGMFINPERAQQVAFADPDYCATTGRSEEHTYELQSLLRNTYAASCWQKKQHT